MARTQPDIDSFFPESQNEDTISYVSPSQHDETVDLADDEEAFNFEEYIEEIEKQEEPKTAKDPLTAITMELMGKQQPALSTSSGKGAAPKKQLVPKKKPAQTMASLVALAKKVKKLRVEKLMSLDDTKNLSELKPETIVVVTAAELRPAKHGDVAIFTCLEIMPDGKREHLRLMIPARFYNNTNKFPCIMAYLGTKNVKSSKTSRQVECYENKKELYDRALELSWLTVVELGNVFNIKSFKDFKV